MVRGQCSSSIPPFTPTLQRKCDRLVADQLCICNTAHLFTLSWLRLFLTPSSLPFYSNILPALQRLPFPNRIKKYGAPFAHCRRRGCNARTRLFWSLCRID